MEILPKSVDLMNNGEATMAEKAATLEKGKEGEKT